MSERIEQIWVDAQAAGHPITQRILANQSTLPYTILSEREIHARLSELTLTEGKRIVLLTRYPGRLVKPCPATNHPYICCQYTVINQANQCPFDCTYCILQGYLEYPLNRLFVNLEDIFREIEMMQSDEPRRFFRFGTGELGDSLALDAISGMSADWIPFFNQRRNALLELKTKSVQIDAVLKQNPKHVVIGWSLNPPAVIQKEELFAADLAARLKAAKKCQDAGYLLSFHFDPILWSPDWQIKYSRLIAQLFDAINWKRIAWISLGTLRFPPHLKPVIESRFPGSDIVYQEMIRGEDGKQRYPKPRRIEMYQSIFHHLKKGRPDLFVYFCMESSSVWKRVTGDAPDSNADLDFRFAESVHSRFPNVEMDEPQRDFYHEVKTVNLKEY